MHGLWRLLVPWTPNFAPEQVETVMFSLLEKGLPPYSRKDDDAWSPPEHQALPCLKMIPRIEVSSCLMLGPS